MIKIAKNATIYIVAPANVATGGPELLHQLGAKLIKRNLDVKMFYFDREEKVPVHPSYTEYGVPWCKSIEDKPTNIIITPETITGILQSFKNLKKVIWWQSVDNHFLTLSPKKSMINSWLLNYVKRQRYLFMDDTVKTADYHLAQSDYALQFLARNHLQPAAFLSDFLHPNFLREALLPLPTKENIVLYNPRKGQKFTNKLISRYPDVKFIPLQGYTRSEVIGLMKRAKLYIDFGFHPGKDRMPREAVHLKCCIIVGKLGSARNSQDVPIPENYKFNLQRSSISHIGTRIWDIFEHYHHHVKEFDQYRHIITKDEEQFQNDIQKVFSLKQDNDPQVSVCIPAYNSFEKFQRCLKSVQKQTGCNFEIIVSDDSTDAIHQSKIANLCYSTNIKYFHHKPNLGVPNNWNFLLNNATAPLVHIMHHDDRYSSSRSLSRFVSLMESNPKYSMAISSSELIEDGIVVGRTEVSIPLLNRINKSPSLMYALNCLGAPSAAVFRREYGILYRQGFKYVTDLVYYYDNYLAGPLACCSDTLVQVDVSKKGRLTTENEENSLLMVSEFSKMMTVFRLRDWHLRIGWRFLFLMMKTTFTAFLNINRNLMLKLQRIIK